jgi:hypothetical protein
MKFPFFLGTEPGFLAGLKPGLAIGTENPHLPERSEGREDLQWIARPFLPN